jgi:hypothetical protein
MVTCPAVSKHMLKDSWIPKFNRVLLSWNKTVSDKADAVSYLVAELVAKEMKSHATGESLILTAQSVTGDLNCEN